MPTSWQVPPGRRRPDTATAGRTAVVAAKGASLDVAVRELVGAIHEGGYLLDSGSPYRLWFGFGLSSGGGMDDPIVGYGIYSHSLLREAKEELAAAF